MPPCTADAIDAWDASALAAAVRTAAGAGRPALTVALRDGGRHRLAAAARRWPFLQWYAIPTARSVAIAAAVACAPTGCRAVCVPGDARLAHAIASRLGAMASGAAGRLDGAWTVDPWSLPTVRRAVAAAAAERIDREPPAPAGAASPDDRRAARLRARMDALPPGIGDDGPALAVQPDRGWAWWRCPDLAAAQAAQRRLVGHGVVVRRHGRVLALPAGLRHGLAGAPADAPMAPAPSAEALLVIGSHAALAADTLAARIDGSLGAGRVLVAVGGFAAERIADLAEDLRHIARLRPFLEVHLAALADAAFLALPGRLDEESEAVRADLAWSGVQPDRAALDACLADARADRSLMPEPWQEVLQGLAAGEAHHGGAGAGEEVAVALAGAVAGAGPAPVGAPLPIAPAATVLVEPVPAVEHGTATAAALIRGIRILTGLDAVDGGDGWVGVRVPEPATVLRALVAQGVLARRCGSTVLLPCGAGFAPRREIRSILAAFAAAISLLAPATTPCRGSATAPPAPLPLRA
jgi:hypothetical protein